MSNVLPEIATIRRLLGPDTGDIVPSPAAAASAGPASTRAPAASPGPALRVAVITPYCNESEALLDACHRSVLAQTYPCTHILVADGAPAPFVRAWAAQHIVLPRRHADAGDTPRAIASLSAIAQGFDAITYLDGDNWYDPEHIATMIALHLKAGASVCVASRSLHRLDGSVLFSGGERNDGVEHVDTNCLFLTSAAFRVIPVWSLMPRRLHPIGDRIVWSAVRALGYRVARWTTPTVRYRTAFRVHYEEKGEVPPPGAKDNAHILEALAWWRGLTDHDRQIVFKRVGFSF